MLWVDGVRAMLDAGVTSFTEFGPGRVLTGTVGRTIGQTGSNTGRTVELRNVASAADARGEVVRSSAVSTGGPLVGKTAAVTGGARGIGRAIAMELGRQGANMIITYRAEELLANAVAGDIRALGTECTTVRVDVRNNEDIEHLFQEARQAHGGVDILVNNAGVNDDGLVMRMSEESWDKVIETNLKGTFLATRLALRHMTRARWGRVINITSIAGVMGNAGQANYAAAKAGIIGFTRSVAREVASRHRHRQRRRARDSSRPT